MRVPPHPDPTSARRPGDRSQNPPPVSPAPLQRPGGKDTAMGSLGRKSSGDMTGRFLHVFILAGLLAAAVGGEASPGGGGGARRDDRVMVCYFGSWAVYRPGAGRFDVEDIDTDICTHLIYGFAGLKADTHEIVSLDPYNDLDVNYGKGAFKRFTGLKKLNPDLKTLLAIGGWNEGSSKYSQMAATEDSRAKFITSCVLFLQKFGFDGLDLDWEYPTLRGGKPEDKLNFALLLDEMRSRFDKQGLMLTAAVSAGEATIDAAYNVSALVRNLDFVHLMAYDLHGTWEQYAHHHSPLYAYAGDKGGNLKLNVDYAVQYWLKLGVPETKLVLGIGLYGRCFTLARADQHDVYSPSYQPGLPGPYTRSPGMQGFNEICESEGREAWTVVRDTHMVSPFAYRERQWCGYDDVQSVETKASYIVSLGLAGAMVWSIETDDFHGNCHAGPFPLITTIRTTVHSAMPSLSSLSLFDIWISVAEPRSGSTNTVCHREGFNTDPKDCTAFYSCHQVGDHWQVYHFQCAPGTVFVEDLQTCDFAQDHQDLCVNNSYSYHHQNPNSIDYDYEVDQNRLNKVPKAKKTDFLEKMKRFEKKLKEISEAAFLDTTQASVKTRTVEIPAKDDASKRSQHRQAKKLRMMKKKSNKNGPEGLY
ncbi:chitinase 5 [Penaeus vannamei]|uniref:chitinase n=1 Tax=Penaeus vannamei TaxID=6689 RepID=A0A3R7NQL7_PENVA|nr:chitinase 5 [Penaeus vannamei]